MIRRTTTLLCAIAAMLSSRAAIAQTRSRFSFGVAGGFGFTSGGDTLYVASPGYVVRIFGAVRVFGHDVEASSFYEDFSRYLIHPADYACLPNAPCQVKYRFDGQSIGVWLGRANAVASHRFQVGLGRYHVVAQHPYNRQLSDVTALGVHFDAEKALLVGNHGMIAIGTHIVMLPNVHERRLWYVPLEARIRWW